MVNLDETGEKIVRALVVVVVLAVFFFIIYVAKCDSDKEHERLKSELRNIDGYVLVNVHCGSGLSASHCYGYISNSDYSAFVDNELNKNIIIEDPYKENERIVVTLESVKYIEVVREDDVVDYYEK